MYDANLSEIFTKSPLCIFNIGFCYTWHGIIDVQNSFCVILC